MKIIDNRIRAVNAELHSDLEEFLIESGFEQKNLYGINIYYDDGEIEIDSAINPPRNRDAGYPRVGRGVACPLAREKIVEAIELFGLTKMDAKNSKRLEELNFYEQELLDYVVGENIYQNQDESIMKIYDQWEHCI